MNEIYFFSRCIGLVVMLFAATIMIAAEQSNEGREASEKIESKQKLRQLTQMPEAMRDELRAIMEEDSYTNDEERMQARRAWREKHQDFFEQRRAILLEHSRSQPQGYRIPEGVAEGRPLRPLPESMDPKLREVLQERQALQRDRYQFLAQHTGAKGGEYISEEAYREAMQLWHRQNGERMEQLNQRLQAYSEKQADQPDASGYSPNQRMQWQRDPSTAPPEFRQRLQARQQLRESLSQATTAEQRRQLVQQFTAAERERRELARQRADE